MLLLIGLTFVLIFLGMEICWAIGIACLSYLILGNVTGDNPLPFVLFSQQVVDGVDSFPLLAIPLFIFAGLLMSASGITARLIRCAGAFVGHIHGGLANVAVTSNFLMSGMSGSAIADAASTGSVLIPEMKRKGYPAAFACAVIAAASTVGPIIPPSIMFVLLGAIINLSVGKLFLGGVLPGAFMFIAMFVLTYMICRWRGYPREPRAGWRERGTAVLAALLPLAAPLVVVRSMVVGVATPTEAAAILVFYVLIVGVVFYRSLSVDAIMHCAARAGLLTAAIMLVVATSKMFTWLAVQEDFGAAIANAMLAISDNVYVLLLLTNVVLLILGALMDPLPIILVLGPILFPLFQSMGVDPIHFGVVMTVNLILGLTTPPVGLILTVVGVIGRSDVMAIFRAAVPYIATLFLVLLAITFVPPIVLWLPNLLLP